jgi:hypothetical protein
LEVRGFGDSSRLSITNGRDWLVRLEAEIPAGRTGPHDSGRARCSPDPLALNPPGIPTCHVSPQTRLMINNPSKSILNPLSIALKIMQSKILSALSSFEPGRPTTNRQCCQEPGNMTETWEHLTGGLWSPRAPMLIPRLSTQNLIGHLRR